MTPAELLDRYYKAEADRYEHTTRATEAAGIKHNVIYDLHHVHGWGWQQIGTELGMTRQAAVYYAKKAMR